jgi:hypothetical protein
MRIKIALALAIIAALAISAGAQNQQDFSKVEIKTTKIKDNFTRLTGRAAPSAS